MSPKDKVKKKSLEGGGSRELKFYHRNGANTRLNHYDLIGAIKIVSWES